MKNEIFMFFNKPDDSEAEISRSVGGFYKFISDDFEICFEQIAARREGAMRAL